MPLLDHFQPPLYPRHRWHGFHNAWATYLAAALNGALPPGYFAEPNVQFSLKIDTAVLRETVVAYTVSPQLANAEGVNGTHDTAVWQPSTPTQSIPFEPAPDHVEVLIYEETGGPTLVGVIELVSPANKDRPAQRNAFTAKCENFLRMGVGLVVIDVVTTYKANLHHALLQRIHSSADEQSNPDTLYMVAYHPVERDGESALDIWYEGLALGQVLPTMPLWLRGGPCMAVALETTYQRTCQEQRISIEPV
jgi:hypothetical protein